MADQDGLSWRTDKAGGRAMKTIAIPIYGGKLIVATSQAEFDRAYDRVLDSQGLERTEEIAGLRQIGMTANAVVNNQLVIVTGVFDRSGATRCHEATHCAQAVAEAVGMDPLREQEAFAYLTQWFYEELAP